MVIKVVQKLCKEGKFKDALYLVEGMVQQTTIEKSLEDAFASLLKVCAKRKALTEGKQVHALIVQSKCNSNIFLANNLIDMYSKCGSLQDACMTFYAMPQRNVVSWTTMISAYAKCGCVEDAREVFNNMNNRNLVSWTAMVAAYAQNGFGREALALYEQMKHEGIQPDKVTLICVLKACSSIGAIEQGKKIQSLIMEKGFALDLTVQCTLVDMYAKCGCPEDARTLFNNMNERNVVSWNAMVAGYIKNGLGKEALALYEQMKQEGIQPNKVTLVCALRACASIGALEQGKLIHSFILEKGYGLDVILQNTLVDMYAKCGCLKDARELFNGMSKRDLVSWNAMIAGYAQDGLGKEALALYEQMKQERLQPDKVTFVCVLKACANIGALEQGKLIHCLLVEKGFNLDVIIQNALVDMYVKCGCLEDARKLFNDMSGRNVISWTAMIAGYAQNGFGKEALALYEQMKQEGIQPEDMTYSCVLSACNNAGLVEEGFCVFDFMYKYSVVSPTSTHYACMVDLLGRAGLAAEAEDFIMKMPIQPHSVVWMSLLGTAKNAGNVEIGQHAFNNMARMEPENAAPYLLLIDIYETVGRMDKVAEMRRNNGKGLRKKASGYS